VVNQTGPVERGDAIQLSFAFQDRDSVAEARIYLDTNSDPLDGNEVLINTIALDATGDIVLEWSGSVGTSVAIPGTYRVFAEIDDGQHRRHHYADGTITVVDTKPPAVTQSQINDGGTYRSLLTTVTVRFNEDVLVLGPLHLQNLTSGQLIDPQLIASEYDEQIQSIEWTFPNLDGGSLPDGYYRATLFADIVVDVGGNALLDDVDWTFDFHRYYGDVDGDRDVDNLDLFAFRRTFGLQTGNAQFNAAFDRDGDGDVDNLELFGFRGNFNTVLEPQPGGGGGSAGPIGGGGGASTVDFNNLVATLAPVLAPIVRGAPVLAVDDESMFTWDTEFSIDRLLNTR